MLALLAATMITSGHFSVQRSQDGLWRFADPSGHLFQSIGVCCLNRGETPATFSEINPGYGAFRFYRSDGAWAQDVSKRLRRWGFNTVGAWADHDLLANSGLYQTPVLHLSASGIPWVDMWDPAVVEATKAVAKPQIEKWRDLPGLVGYFSDNELGWWIGAHFEWAWKMKPEFEGRHKLIELTKAMYPTWDRLREDFEPSEASSYDELAKKGRLYLRPGRLGMRLVRAWLGVAADRYYSLCKETIRELDPKALYLGDRYISGYYPEVAAQAGRYCDVVSTNLNADWPNGDIAPYYLDGLWAITKKPILITEYYACAMDNRSGNMNDASGFPTLPTQKARAESASRQTRSILGKPYVVGAHWFQYYDEPTHGRGDGENYDMGLVDIDNRPYDALTRVFRQSAPRANGGDKGKGIPYLSPTTGSDLAQWPHDEAAQRRTDGDPRGDLFLAWNSSGLYIAAYWKEGRFAEAMYRDGKLPDEDRATLTIKIPGLDEVTVKVGERSADVTTARLLKVETGVNNAVVLRVPANLFGVRSIAPGRTISYQAELRTQARAYTLRWSGAAVTEASR